MLQGEHFAILLTFIKLPFVIKIFVLSSLSGRFTQVLLYTFIKARNEIIGVTSTVKFGKFKVLGTRGLILNYQYFEL